MSCACSGNRSYSALVYQGRHDRFFGKWECFAWNVLDFFILTSRIRRIKLLSFRKDHMDVVVSARAARSEKETATEDAKARINLLCGDNSNCGTREKPCKNKVSCHCKKIITIAIRVYLNRPSTCNRHLVLVGTILKYSAEFFKF